MSEPITQSDSTKPIVVANIGGYNYIQSDLNNLMFAFTLHSIHKNTGIDFHTFASFEASIQGAILSAVTNMENNKVGIVQYREAVEAAANYVPTTEGMNTHQPCPTDYDRTAMAGNQYPHAGTQIPPWLQQDTPAWAKGGMGMPNGNQRPVIFNTMELHKALDLLLTILPQLHSSILATRFMFQGKVIAVSDALYYLNQGIKQCHPDITNSRKF